MDAPTEERRWPLPLLWAGLAASYLALGKLGLLLAIPPGYATAIFPPAGLALHQALKRGARVLPGLWLGSFLMNLWVSWNLGPRPALVLMSALIALGAVLQAWLGARLARAVAEHPLDLRSARDLLAVLGLGGGLACLIGATIGVAGLRGLAGLPAPGAAYAWWTWYVGDALGVVIIVPALEMALAPPGSLWHERRRAVGVPLLLTSAVVVGLFMRVSAREVESLRQALRLRGEQARSELQAQLKARLEMLQALEGLFQAIPSVDRRAFEHFVEPYLQRHRDLHSVDWSTRVPGEARGAYEARMREQYGGAFEIQEMGSDLRIHPAAVRDEYWPVTYKFPIPFNRLALGLDLRTRPFQGPRMQAALDEGIPSLIVLEGLAQDPVARPAMVLTLPTYEGGRRPEDPESRRAAFLGFHSALFYVDPLLEEAQLRAGPGEVTLHLLVTRTDGQRFEAGHTGLAGEPSFREDLPFQIYGTQAVLRIEPTPAYLLGRKPWQVFLVLAGGLAVTGMLGALLLLISAQVHEVRGLAETRGRSLADLEARAKVILEHAVEPILTLDPAGTILAANAAAERLFQRPAGELQGRAVGEFVPGLLTQLRHAESTGSIREATAFPRIGEPIPVEVGLNAVVLDQQTLFTAFLRDLRERRRVERLKNEFIAVVSHELRTPLTSIRGTLGLLEGGVAGPLPERATGLVHIAHDNAVRLGRLVDDILDLEKLEQGKLRLDRQVMPLAPILEQSLESVRGTAEKAGVHLAQTPEGHPEARARVDGGRLVQVLANLLSNAIKHSPAQGLVRLGLGPCPAGWRLEVRDQGPGVPAAFQGELFEKFTQADPSEDRVVQGTGLGLAIARSLVERMDGTIGFENAPEGGAIFFVELPRA